MPVAQTTTPTQAPDIAGPLFQYGAIGIVAVIALYAVSKLFSRQIAAHEKDIARADRLEAELRDQNKVIQEKLVVQLTLATEAIAKLLDQLERARLK